MSVVNIEKTDVKYIDTLIHRSPLSPIYFAVAEIENAKVTFISCLRAVNNLSSVFPLLNA